MCYKLLPNHSDFYTLSQTKLLENHTVHRGPYIPQLIAPLQGPRPFRVAPFPPQFWSFNMALSRAKTFTRQTKTAVLQAMKERKYQLPVAIFDVREVNVLVFKVPNKDLL